MAWPFGGLPLGGVFLGQADGPVLGVARLGGPLALTAMVYVGGVGVGALGEAVARALRDGARARAFDARGPDGVNPPADADPAGGLRHTVAGAVAGLGPLALVGVVAGLVVVGVSVGADHAPDGGASVGTVSAAAVQGGGGRGFSKSQINPSVVLAAQMSETRRLEERGDGAATGAVARGRGLPRHPAVRFPRAVGPLLPGPHPARHLGGGGDRGHLGHRLPQRGGGLRPDGTLVSRYEKVHRVPFGEYVPYRSFFAHLANLSAVPLDAVPGTGTGLLPTPAAPLGAMISYEVFYADRGRSSVRDGAQLADRPDQHLVVRHRPGAHPGDRRLPGPSRPAGSRPPPGGAHRVQRGRSPIAAWSCSARCWVPPRSSPPTSPAGLDGPCTSGSATGPHWDWRRRPCSSAGSWPADASRLIPRRHPDGT